MSIPVPDEPQIKLVQGSVWLNAACYARYFGGTHSIILLYEAEQHHLWVLPVRSERAGGFLLKYVNRHGDRCAASYGFFRDHGISETLEATFVPRWDSERQGIVLDLSEANDRQRAANETIS